MDSETFVTFKSGDDCKIIGNEKAIDRMIELLEKAGFKWNEQICTWDEGFYEPA